MVGWHESAHLFFVCPLTAMAYHPHTANLNEKC